MANDPQEQPSHTESTATMARTKSFHPKKPPPADLVSLFQTKNLQNELKQILQHHKISHLDQMFVPHMNSQILGPFLLAYLYRSCQDVTAYPLGSSGGPLWVL
ncbi:hypothetical protein SLEP1_g50402 [Rubroshorea leprosula]|uniref:Uncharacterized protein n=1 Tax=Rubroshorea leprosula TaxID=152421 RepID=A0AAV5M2F0_9ROSI|nr:hypothetical protein SLEP1_g50402 [Rubroshorea leprosula]